MQTNPSTIYGQVNFVGQDSIKVKILETSQEVFADEQGFFEIAMPNGYKQINLQVVTPSEIVPSFSVSIKRNRNLFAYFYIKKIITEIYEQNKPILWVEYNKIYYHKEERFSDVPKRVHLTGLYPFEDGCEDTKQYGLDKTNRELGLPCKATMTISKLIKNGDQGLKRFEIIKGQPIDVFIPKMDFMITIEVPTEVRRRVHQNMALYKYLRTGHTKIVLESLNKPTCFVPDPSDRDYIDPTGLLPPAPFTCKYLNN